MEQNNEKEKKTASYIGFAVRSRACTIGCDITVDAIRHGKAKKIPLVVVIASDAADNTVKRAVNACKYYGIECVHTSMTGEQLGKISGKSATSVIGITNENLAKAILSVAN